VVETGAASPTRTQGKADKMAALEQQRPATLSDTQQFWICPGHGPKRILLPLRGSSVDAAGLEYGRLCSHIPTDARTHIPFRDKKLKRRDFYENLACGSYYCFKYRVCVMGCSAIRLWQCTLLLIEHRNGTDGRIG
jgi:hypothetical protein